MGGHRTQGTWAVDGPEGEATEFDDLAALVSGDEAAGRRDRRRDDGTESRRPSEVAAAPTPPSRRAPRLGFLGALGVLAVLVLAFVIAAAWARRGYFVAFDQDDDVVDVPRPRPTASCGSIRRWKPWPT